MHITSRIPFLLSQSTTIIRMLTEKTQVKDPLMGTRYSQLSTSETSDDVKVVWNIDLKNQRKLLSLLMRLTPYLLHAFLLVSYTIVFIISYGKYTRGPPIVDELGIPYVPQVFEVNPALNESIARLYTGPPSDELDKAWDKLLQYGNIRVPEAEMRKLGRLDEGVRFTDGSGYFGQMTMYHHLHCIMRVHHFLHVEHYWPNATDDELYLLRAHNYHCLDTLRQAILCQGDTSLITFRFGSSQPIPLGNFTTPHTCKSWPAIESYNKDRFVDVFQPGLVVHPKFGWAYAGEGTNIGVVVEEDPTKEVGKEKRIIEGRDEPVVGVASVFEVEYHNGVNKVRIEGGTMETNGVEKRQKVKIASGTEVGNGNQKRPKFNRGKVNKKIDQWQSNDPRIRGQELRAAWNRRDEKEDDEGRKRKVAAGNLLWKRQEEARQGGGVWKGEPAILPEKREAKPPVKVGRDSNVPDKGEYSLRPMPW